MATLLTPKEAAERLLISERTLRDLKRTGAISYVAIGARRIAYREEDIVKFIESRVRQESPPPVRSISGRLRRSSGSISDQPVGFLEGCEARRAERERLKQRSRT